MRSKKRANSGINSSRYGLERLLRMIVVGSNTLNAGGDLFCFYMRDFGSGNTEPLKARKRLVSRRDKHRYKRVSYDGSSFICKPDEVEELTRLDGCDDDMQYQVSDIWMTDDEYERLPEFEGF